MARIARTLNANQPERAVIYRRVSTPGQADDDGTSLDTQDGRCRAYVADHGYELVGVFTDVHSGAHLHERVDLTRLRDLVRTGAVDVVVSYALDRLSRSQAHIYILDDEFGRLGCRLEFVTEDFEDSPVGRFIRSGKAFAAEVEREKIRERTLRGRRARIDSGKVPNAGFELYGYRRDRERGVRAIYEPEAQIVRQMFTWIGEEGIAIREGIRRLNAMGVPVPSAGKVKFTDTDRVAHWHNGTFHRILKNPAYKGEPYAWRWQGRENQHGSDMRAADNWIALPPETTPAIVSTQLWDATAQRLASNRGAQTRNIKIPYLLRGMITCSVCERPMFGAFYKADRGGRGKEYRYYRCSARLATGTSCGGGMIAVADVEAWVWEQVAGVLRDPMTVARELQRRAAAGKGPTLAAERTAALRQLAKLQHQQERLIRRYREAEDDSFPWQLIEREIAQVEREKTAQQSRLDGIEAQIASEEAAIDQLGRLSAYCGKVAANLDRLDFNGRRDALEALEVHVRGSGKEWRLTGAVPFGDPDGITATTDQDPDDGDDSSVVLSQPSAVPRQIYKLPFAITKAAGLHVIG